MAAHRAGYRVSWRHDIHALRLASFFGDPAPGSGARGRRSLSLRHFPSPRRVDRDAVARSRLVEEALQFGHGVDQPFGTLCVHKKNGEGGRIETVKWFYKWTGSEETWDELVAYKEKTKAEMQGGK